ncbi:hypothetical protein IT402_01460 [Candidatus Nomurabacteria bacterium]|nr:hypothetical protein [Candidatus Nomurabacteria bacterium]
MYRKITIQLVFVLALIFPLFYFQNASALIITQNDNVSVSAVVGTLPTIDPGGGGGGVYQSGVRFSGLAYPNAIVTVQKRDGDISTVSADALGKFSITIYETNWQFFTLFATDELGRRSTLLNFPTVLYSGIITDISGIKFAPTIDTDKIAVKQGDFLTVEGSALPNTEVQIAFDGPESKVFSLVSNNKGFYNVTIPINLKQGDYSLRASYPADTRTSKVIRISVGNASILRTEATNNIPGDCNFDQRVTLVDFSVLAFWYQKSNPPKCVDTNSDGIINLVDFSILAFYWNG